MPAEFALFPFRSQESRLWTPLAFTPEERPRYHLNNRWHLLARLQPGVTLAQAQARIDALNQRNMARMPDLKPLLEDAGFHTPVRVFQEELVRDLRGILFLLWGGVTCVLLIGAVNVANLVLMRATARGREIATCVALGASRPRIVRQMVTESLLLAVLGGSLGWLIARAGLDGLSAMGLETLPRSGEIRLDSTAMVFTIGVAMVVGALMALLPAVRILHVSPTDVLREEGRSGTASRSVRLARQALVVTQIAMALVLLAGAGLLLASFRELLAIDPGFEPRGVLTARIDLPGSSRYEDDAARRSFFERAFARLRALPGVESVGITNYIPFGGDYSRQAIFPEGYVPRPGESVVSPSQSVVTPGYFESMDIRIIEGRGFDDRDNTEGRPVIVIDQRLARRFWPDGEPSADACGDRRARMPTGSEQGTTLRCRWHRRVRSNAWGGEPRGSNRGVLFRLRRGWTTTSRLPSGHRVSQAASSSRSAAPSPRSIPQLPIFDIRSMEARISRSLSDRRTPMVLTLGFGVLALCSRSSASTGARVTRPAADAGDRDSDGPRQRRDGDLPARAARRGGDARSRLARRPCRHCRHAPRDREPASRHLTAGSRSPGDCCRPHGWRGRSCLSDSGTPGDSGRSRFRCSRNRRGDLESLQPSMARDCRKLASGQMSHA